MSVKLTWYGHAAWGIEAGGYNLLIDPFFTDNPVAATKADEVKADFILVSHGHSDHVGDTVEIAERTGATVVANYEVATWLTNKGVKNTHAMHIGGAHDFPFGRVKLTIAHHGSMLPDGSYGGNPAGFLLTIEGKKIYFAGDTSLTYDMKWLADDGVDLALLPIGDNFTMGPEDAVKAAKLIQPKVVIPMHYNTWPVIEQNAEDFCSMLGKECKARCVVLKPGESYEF